MRMQTYSNWTINHKESFNEELVRTFVETQDEEAFNEIVHFYADKIYMLALRITRNLRDADEVLQEVFLTMEKLNTFPGESNFSNWLHGVVINESYKHLRAKKSNDKEVSLEDHGSQSIR
jgi:RNA polymerase sigma-70 factor (ECF subfamily)